MTHWWGGYQTVGQATLGIDPDMGLHSDALYAAQS